MRFVPFRNGRRDQNGYQSQLSTGFSPVIRQTQRGHEEDDALLEPGVDWIFHLSSNDHPAPSAAVLLGRQTHS